MREIKGLSMTSAILSLIDVESYEIPAPGKYNAELKFKIWGKYPCLHCFFITDEGQKIRLAAFIDKETGKYTSRDLDIDFSKAGIEGIKYRIHVAKNSKGRPAWLSAERISTQMKLTP